MTGKPQDESMPSQIIRLFEDGGRYTTQELSELLHKDRPNYRFEYLKRQVQQCISHLKAGTRQKDQGPMNIQKVEDGGVKRWRLIKDEQ
jgi:hypothetical protein